MTLAELKEFHPEEGMILANTTSVGMKPRIHDTPLPKVRPILFPFIIFICSFAYTPFNIKNFEKIQLN